MYLIRQITFILKGIEGNESSSLITNVIGDLIKHNPNNLAYEHILSSCNDLLKFKIQLRNIIQSIENEIRPENRKNLTITHKKNVSKIAVKCITHYREILGKMYEEAYVECVKHKRDMKIRDPERIQEPHYAAEIAFFTRGVHVLDEINFNAYLIKKIIELRNDQELDKLYRTLMIYINNKNIEKELKDINREINHIDSDYDFFPKELVLKFESTIKSLR